MRRAGRFAGYAVALVGVIVVTAVVAALALDARVGNASILYLPVVLAVAARFGRGPAVLGAIASFLFYDWFFVEPRHQLVVADPAALLALLLLIGTALVTGQLVADQRARAGEAQDREREAVVLYDVVRIIGESDAENALDLLAQRLRRELSVSGVAIEVKLGGSSRRSVSGDESARAKLAAARPDEVLGLGRAPTAEERAGPQRWVRIVSPYARALRDDRLSAVPITAGERRLGTMLLLRPPGSKRFSRSEDRLLSAVAAQIGLGVERARLRDEAAEADALRRADELKSALLDAVSHDLRTPLASILASVTSLRQRDVEWSDAQREEFLGAIEEETRRLDRLVGNLLDLSRIEAGGLRPQRAWYDAGALVDDVVGRLRGVTQGHPVRVDVATDLPPISLDYVEIDQVLSNLVENAARYSPTGTPIEIAVSPGDDAVRFEVRDHGPGMTARAERDLFVPFVSSAAPRTDGRHGIGLGLSVARRLVEAHGGRLWFERPEDGGSRFVFLLPTREVAA